MNNLQSITNNYFNYCQYQKRLDAKTLKAYRIDLKQFLDFSNVSTLNSFTPTILEHYIMQLHQQFKPKTVKRKIASVKAFFRYLDYRDYIEYNPFNKVEVRFREPVILPKTIPLNTVEKLLYTMYHCHLTASTTYRKKSVLRDIAVIELLFATGMRISELCSLTPADINLSEQTVLIFGKGSKERKLQLGNDAVISILSEYYHTFSNEIYQCNHFFANPSGTALTDQSVRRMIKKYSDLAAIDLHITPHMFRHTFATSLLEADVDIRYIQEMLGHSSINITEIYTHVTMAKQRDILSTKHPRKDFKVG